MIISIFGPDGSGKSTQARILANYLIHQGFIVRIVWIKSYHTLAYVLSRIIGKLSPHSVRLNAYGHVIRIDMFTASRFNPLIWSIIEFASILPLVLLQVYSPLRLGVVIVCERFLVDSIVSIAYALNDPNFDQVLSQK